MFQDMKYLLQTKEMGLKISPNLSKDNLSQWSMQIFSDTDWATSNKDRKSISGFVIYLQGTPIMWQSQGQKSVSLSSTEAEEYYAMSEAAKIIKFTIQVLESLEIK
jgi:hypothetical protein